MSAYYTVSKYSRLVKTPDLKGSRQFIRFPSHSTSKAKVLPKSTDKRKGMLLCLELLYVKALEFFKITVLYLNVLAKTCLLKGIFEENRIILQTSTTQESPRMKAIISDCMYKNTG